TGNVTTREVPGGSFTSAAHIVATRADVTLPPVAAQHQGNLSSDLTRFVEHLSVTVAQGRAPLDRGMVVPQAVSEPAIPFVAHTAIELDPDSQCVIIDIH